MQQKRSSWPAIVIVVIAILTLYVGSYFALSDKASISFSGPPTSLRVCRYQWMMKAYQPLTAIEGRLTGEEIELIYLW